MRYRRTFIDNATYYRRNLESKSGAHCRQFGRSMRQHLDGQIYGGKRTGFLRRHSKQQQSLGIRQENSCRLSEAIIMRLVALANRNRIVLM